MKKRKMDTPEQTQQAAASAADATSAAPAAVDAPTTAATVAAADVNMTDTAGAGTAATDDEPSSSPAAVSSATAEELAELTAALPGALTLLRKLNTDIVTCKTPQFHALRKEVLRLAAALQNSHFTGETKDEAQKRLHRRREKGERMAREARQKNADLKHVNSVALRNARIQALNAMVEPEGWGDKKGDQLLLPGAASKLLMAPTAEPDSAASASASAASPSPSPSPDTAAIEAARQAALAAAAGPQSYVYPTIAPASALAELVASSGPAAANVAALSKPFVRGGMSSVTVASVPTDSDATPAPVIVPSLVTVEDETAEAEAEAEQAKGKNKKLVAHGQGKKAAAGRAQKKAMFQQEGVHVNPEVLKENAAKEAELKAANKDKSAQSTDTAAAGAPMEDAAASSSSAPSSSPPAPAGFSSDPVASSPAQPEFGPVLNHPRSCYCCKARFFQLHFFYSEFCGPCARLNFAKRNQVADLRGKVVLLTGSRVKIGFRCGLRLLRCGALLIATSRFPHDTAKRYAEEADFNEWKHRLHIYGLDLRDLKSVVKLSEILSSRYDRLDAIINNAAQTVRRPPMYYRHLLPIETMKPKDMPAGWREVVKGDLHEMAQRNRLKQAEDAGQARLDEGKSGDNKAGITLEDISHLPSDASNAAVPTEHTVSHAEAAPAAASASAAAPADTGAASESADSAAAAIADVSSSMMSAFDRHDDINSALLTSSNRAAALSQLAVLPGDQHQDSALFPLNRFDVTGQQLDLRTVNSWNLCLDQVDPSELVEVFAINALSPFILNSRLKALMLRGGAHPHLGPSVQTTDKYIINVSAMEGKFYRHKSPFHPHTNAAKAALNMLTRTSSQDYAKDRIYMNSVDTGWINDENPHETAKRLFEQANFQTPIDEEDAMARILDPLLSGVATGINCFGKFFKDYHETEW